MTVITYCFYVILLLGVNVRDSVYYIDTDEIPE